LILNVVFSKEFLKPYYQTENLSKGVPRSHLVEGFDQMSCLSLWVDQGVGDAPAAKIKIRKPFSRSSSLKEVVEEEVLPKVSVPMKEKGKGKGIEKPIGVIDRAPLQQKDKGKSIEKPVEVININTPPSNHTFKRLIR
jgi:hypothetical protein